MFILNIMSSIQHSHYQENLRGKLGQRDLFDQLFSDDSPDDDMESMEAVQHQRHTPVTSCEKECRILNIQDILKTFDLEKDIDGHTRYYIEDSSETSMFSGSTDSIRSDMSLSTGESMNISSMHNANSVDTPFSDDSSLDSLTTISSEDRRQLLKDNSQEVVDHRNSHLHRALHSPNGSQNDSPSDVPIEFHEDIIASFNVQNKYEHSAAAKLFVDGNFTFLSIQEPYASHTNLQKSWKACQISELDSARIACHETHHQIILYDSWKWGGKVISNFGSELNGRVTHIAFQFEGNQTLGIISVYAVARGGDTLEKTRKEKLRQTTVTLIKRQVRKWRKVFPMIQIMIVGDMQETESIGDMDNIGTSRYSNTCENGILRAFQETHTSVVRDRFQGSRYITRVGREGGRGIDHILFPKDDQAQALIKCAFIDDTLANLYFPSDHKLIKCTYIRKGNNNEELSPNSTKYSFNKISQIKMKRISCEGKQKLIFDDSQFKGSRRYKEHKKLFEKVQEITGDEGEMTRYHIGKLESRISKLYSSLWEAGVKQGCRGEANILVDINESQAAQLSQIYKEFEYGVKDTMHWLKLSKEVDGLQAKAITRNNVRLKGNFKVFNNLPISTKLRYLRSELQSKSRRLRKYINSAKEFMLTNKHAIPENYEGDKIFNDWKKSISTLSIKDKAEKILKAYNIEKDERILHMDAVNAMQSRKPNLNIGAPDDEPVTRHHNFLLHLPKSTVSAINIWLKDSGCDQGINTYKSGDPFSFLEDRQVWKDWNEELSNMGNSIFHSKPSENELTIIIKKLEKAWDKMHRMETRTSIAQRKYRMETVEFLLRTNKIEAFTKKINPKPRDSPATHTEIWDQKLSKFRPCRNETEELIATGEFHGRWMDNSGAEEICAFAKIENKGNLGARGVTLTPDRKVTFADIPKLIKNGDALPRKIKHAFVKAHGLHTANLFRPPEKDNKALFYPFFLRDYDGVMNEENRFAEMFWKSLTSVPGKARYEGFHMSVIGRFGRKWQTCLYRIIKLILLMRFIPRQLKKVARFPIPKPGRINEYRPISLCQDVYCFINAVSTTYASDGIQKANILHEGITAYVKGKGCTTLVGVEQSIREDCVESGIPMSQTDEDEEKFFDRIPVEVLLAAMRVNGFPTQGFIELKASGMEAKTVEIITGKGVAHARFVCGLEQGNPDSPTISNLVIKFKHDIWRNVLEEINTNIKNSNDPNAARLKNKDAYKFHMADPLDGPVIIDRIGYCDDNSRYTTSYNEEEVIAATRHYIQRAGDLSMVTKIGRKGSKSEVHYFNLSAELALSLKEIETTAWSFSLDKPNSETVPFKIALRQKELDKVFKLTDFYNLNKADQDNILKVFKAEPHKHLGLRSTITGIASEASEEVLRKIKARIHQLKIYSLEQEAQKISCNMLCTSMHSYAPLQMSHKPDKLEECDKLLVKQISKRHGMSLTDAKHALFISERQGGFGFKSFLDVDLISNLRELEIVLNGWMIDSKASRSRLKAYSTYGDFTEENEMRVNHIGEAIKKLAKYGFHVRDREDGVLNYMLSELNQRKIYSSIGSDTYRDSNGYSMGHGKERNLDLAYGGVLHSYIKASSTKGGGDWVTTTEGAEVRQELPIAKSTLKKLFSKAQHKQFVEKASPYNCWEWNGFDERGILSNDIHDRDGWHYVNVMATIRNKYPLTFWKLSNETIGLEAKLILNQRIRLNIPLNEHIESSSGPPLIATDGAHYEDSANMEGIHRTSGAAVVCLLNTNIEEKLEDENWVNRETTPVFARASRLPLQYGCHESDIGHGECTAMCLGLEIMEANIRGILITDSQAIRDVVINIRENHQSLRIDRNYIRSMISGISKSICGRVSAALHTVGNLQLSSVQMDKIKTFLSISKSWIQFPSGEQTKDLWKQEYHDPHTTIPIFKVHSHQLNKQGSTIRKVKKRFNKLIPNLSVLNSNHFADICAEMICGGKFMEPKDIPTSITLPNSELRFTLTWNGLGIDKHVSDLATQKFLSERIKRLRLKATQGLPWRIVPDSTTSWTELKGLKRLWRSLCGLSRTHTRSLYKSSVYRNGCKETAITTDEENPDGSVNWRSSHSWIKNLSPCSWCTAKTSSHGNRYHAMFFCTKTELLNFRLKMSQLLERTFHKMIDHIEFTMNAPAKDQFLDQIEQEMSSLHGKEMMQQSHAHRYYRSRETWMHEENMSWNEILSSEIPIFCHIFGFTPIMEIPFTSDLELTSALSIPLGLIPKKLEAVVQGLASQYIQFYPNQEMCRNMVASLMALWEELKDINVARAMGLHSIIGGVSKKYEKDFKKQENDIQGMQDSDATPPSDGKDGRKLCSILKKRKWSINPGSNQSKRRRVKFTDIFLQKKLCKGITCSAISAGDHFLMGMPAYIQQSKNQCQRCAKQMTALRKGTHSLGQCIKEQSKDVENLVTFMDNQSTKLNYKRLSESLQPDIKHQPAKKSLKLLDSTKTMLKTINTCVTRLTDTSENAKSRVQNATKFMEKTIQASNKFLKDDLIHSKHIDSTLPKIQPCIQKQTKFLQEEGNKAEVTETVWKSNAERKLLRQDQKETLRRGQYMSDRSMNRAVSNIRAAKVKDIYIADPLASAMIRNWNKEKGWEEFAIIFRSLDVIKTKPYGTYIIPIFSGSSDSGHWSFAVISKQYRCCRGWMIDSLGTGRTNGEVADKIDQAFSKRRVRCKWLPTRCFQQQEVECGPRTVWGMVKIQQALQEGKSIEDAVQSACMMQRSREYDAREVRGEASVLIDDSEISRSEIDATARTIRRFMNRRRQKEQRTEAAQPSATDIITID